MSIPKEPRQQMISIMYLVLTALLALNVSAEIIEAFKRFNNSMEASNITVENKISGTYKAFEAAVEKNEGRGQEHLDKAREASTLSQNVAGQLQKIKEDFQSFADDGIAPEALAKANGQMVNASSQDATTKFFVKGTEDGRAPVSPEVRELMGNTRKQFLAYFEDTPDELQQVTALIPEFTMEDGEKDFFYQLPAVAAMTEITRYESLVKSAEAIVVEKLSNRVGVKNVVFNQFEPAIIPNAEKFIDGDPLELDIFLSASSNSSAKPQIFVNGKSLKVGPNGRASFDKNTSGSGDKSLNIEIKAANQFGEMQSYKKKFEYKVVPPFRQEYKGIVSPTAMNVFYIGVDNPVTCGISGIDGSLINASIDGLGGTMQSQGNGKFTVRVKKPSTKTKVAKVTITGPKPKYDRAGGNYSETMEFRAKYIPDPIPEIGGKNGGKMPNGTFKVQKGISATLYDFVFDAKFEVLSCEVTYAPKRDDLQTRTNNGPLFTSGVKDLMSQAKPGDSYFFDDIMVKGPDGNKRNLGTIAFSIK